MSMATSKWASLAALAAVGAFALAGCGSSNSSSATSGGSSSASKGTVGVILPDTTTSPRWENNDRPSLDAAFKAAGVGSDIQNAGGDTAKFGTICDSMINEGVKVLMIVNLDPESGAACLKKATQAGITEHRLRPAHAGWRRVVLRVVRQRQGRRADGRGPDRLPRPRKARPRPTSSTSTAPRPTTTPACSSRATRRPSRPSSTRATTSWSVTSAVSGTPTRRPTRSTVSTPRTTATSTAIVSANDTMAGGIIARLKANGLAGKVPITGQDASIEGLQQILAGNQCMTVYKNTDLEAGLASKLAIDLINGDTAAADALATGSVQDPVTKQNVKSALATPEAIFKSNIKSRSTTGSRRRPTSAPGRTPSSARQPASADAVHEGAGLRAGTLVTRLPSRVPFTTGGPRPHDRHRHRTPAFPPPGPRC